MRGLWVQCLRASLCRRECLRFSRSGSAGSSQTARCRSGRRSRSARCHHPLYPCRRRLAAERPEGVRPLVFQASDCELMQPGLRPGRRLVCETARCASQPSLHRSGPRRSPHEPTTIKPAQLHLPLAAFSSDSGPVEEKCPRAHHLCCRSCCGCRSRGGAGLRERTHAPNNPSF